MKAEPKKILIIEDEDSVIYALTEKFDLLAGIKVLSARDGEQGLTVALQEKPDLILLDIVLPKLDGIELLTKLRQDDWGKEVKVIILSNLSDSNKEQIAKQMGVKDYIIKVDWKIEDVVQKVMAELQLM